MHTSGYLTVWFQYSAHNAAPFQSKISSEPRTMSLAVQSVSCNWLIYGSEKRKTGLGPLTDADAAATVSPSSARPTAMRTYSSSTDLERCLCEILSIFTRTLLLCWTFQFISEWCRRPRYAERIDHFYGVVSVSFPNINQYRERTFMRF